MKLGYVVIGESSSLGVLKKIEDQVSVLHSKQLQVELIVYSISNMNLFLNVPYLRTFEFRWRAFFSMYRKLKEKDFDMFYLRSTPSDLVFLLFSFIMGKKLVVEFNSIRSREMRLSGKYFMSVIEEFFTRLLLRNILGFVGVTDEISQYYAKYVNSNKVRLATVSNGIDVKSVPIKKVRKLDGGLNIIFVGDYNPWFGIDRIIKGARVYRGKDIIRITFVGDGYGKVMEQTFQGNVEFRFTGRLSGDNLDEEFNEADLAIGSLGIHRVGLKQACTLKTREYWARVIPFVISYEDVDVKGRRLDYCLKLSGDESDVDFEVLVDFFKGLDKKGLSERIRRDAEKYVGMGVKMNLLNNFLLSL